MKCHSAERHSVKCHSAERHSVQCHSAECNGFLVEKCQFNAWVGRACNNAFESKSKICVKNNFSKDGQIHKISCCVGPIVIMPLLLSQLKL